MVYVKKVYEVRCDWCLKHIADYTEKPITKDNFVVRRVDKVGEKTTEQYQKKKVNFYNYGRKYRIDSLYAKNHLSTTIQ